MDILKKNLSNIEISEYSDCFEALGAALYAYSNKVKENYNPNNLFIHNKSSFSFLPALKNYANKVKFKTIERKSAVKGDKCYLGIDVGSTTTKAVLIREKDNAIIADVYLRTNGAPIKAAQECYLSLKNQINTEISIVGLGVTGSGRHIVGLHSLTEGIFNEIIAHASAAAYFDKDVDTIFEIGGQDAKYTFLVNGAPADYAMNEACSAGTGSFLEESAYESFRLKVENIESLAMAGATPPNFNDQCAAFISSDIKTASQENITKENIVAGLVYSICLNYVNRVKGNRQIGDKIFMQGGVCYNKAVPIAMAALTGKDIVVPPEPGLMGAFGAALEIKEKIKLGLIKEKKFTLEELIERTPNFKEPFICAGGAEKCDLKCEIARIEIDGKTFPFGGACNKYYNSHFAKQIDPENFDYVQKRKELIFSKYAPNIKLKDSAKSVGVNLSFHAHTLYPLYSNFFAELGFKTILPEKILEEGLERETTSLCYPAQLSLGFFQDLVNKKPDYIFNPSVLEMYVDSTTIHRMDFNSSCVFVSGEPYYVKQAYKDYDFKNKFIDISLNFANGYDTQEKEFLEIGGKLGIKDKEAIIKAYKRGVEMQIAYEQEMFQIGAEFLERLNNEPDKIAIVLFGRSYNAFADSANKGIPKKFAARGYYIVPFDMFDYRAEFCDENMYWEGGKKIVKAAQIVKREPKLYAAYITNFSCGPDSFIISSFRDIMGDKPSLTIEIDGHTADAGINTRIEAFVDVVENYRKVNENAAKKRASEFLLSYFKMSGEQSVFVDSYGNELAITDKRVKILIPAMGDLSSRLFASALRSLGINAEALPEGNNDILGYGRSNSTGKECLPLTLCLGSLIDHLENRRGGDEFTAFFLVRGAGNCRLGQYTAFIRDYIKRKEIKDACVFTLANEDGFAGLGKKFAIRGIQAIISADVLEDVRSAIYAHASYPEPAEQIFDIEFNKLEAVMEKSPSKFIKALENFSKTIRENIHIEKPFNKARYIALCGEIYVRRDGFSHKWLNKYFAKKGFIVKDAYISEWILYVDYLLRKGLLEPNIGTAEKLEIRAREFYIRYAENKIKRTLEKSGFYEYSKTHIKELLEHSEHIVPMSFKGEPGLTLGVGMYEAAEKYCGLINIGPFGCMPTRFTEAVMKSEMNIESKIATRRKHEPKFNMPESIKNANSIPFLTLETDGKVYPQIIESKLETFAVQAERMAKLMEGSSLM